MGQDVDRRSVAGLPPTRLTDVGPEERKMPSLRGPPRLAPYANDAPSLPNTKSHREE